MTTFTGTSGDDTISPELVSTGVLTDGAPTPSEGGDVLDGREGNDVLVATSGRNILAGGEGDDLLVSADGALLFGESGNDTLQGSELDGLFAGDGDDLLTVGFSTQAFGDAGADTVVAAAENNGAAISGGDGDDLFLGVSGNLEVHGDGGDDTMVWNMAGPSFSNSFLEGGAGADTVRVTGPQDDVAWDITVGDDGEGFELVQLTHDAPGAAIDTKLFIQNVERLALQGGRGGDTIVVNDQTGLGVEQLDIDLGAASAGGADGQRDSLTFNATADADDVTVSTVNGALVVAGLAVTATVSNVDHSAAVSDAVLIATGAGDDVVRVSSPSALGGVVTVDGGEGSDAAKLTTTASSAGEAVRLLANGNHASVTVDGAVIVDLANVETIDVSVLQGPDSVTIEDLSATAVRAINVDMTDGAGRPDANGDRVTLNGGASTNRITLVQGLDSRIGIVDATNDTTVVTTVTGLDSEDQLVLATGGGDDFIRIKGAIANVQRLIQAGEGDDEIIMGLGSSTALGGAGNDIIRGAAGRNILSGNDGDDLLVSADGVIALGGAGNDTIQGHALDVLEGDDGDDVISVGASTRANGGAGADSFTAGSDASGAQVSGGDGDDLFVGASGNLIFHADDGDDTMVWDLTGPSSSNTLLEGGAGSDSVRISGPQDDVAWQITVGDNGTGFELVQLAHNAPGAAIDGRMFTQNVEHLAIQGGRGGDTIVVNDQTGLGVQQLEIDLGAAASGGGDGQRDSLTLNATAGADVVAVSAVAGNLVAAGLQVTATVSNLDHSTSVSDAVLIATGAGDDRIDLSALSGFRGVVTVDGGQGDDTVVGGGDAGFTYVFHTDGSDDLITRFEVGSDRIDLTDGPDDSLEALINNHHITEVLTEAGTDVVIDDGAGTVLILANTSLGSLTASDFLFG